MARISLDEWQVESVRATLFPVLGQVDEFDPAAAFRLLVGSEPDDVTFNPKKGTGRLVGAWEAGRVSLQIANDRTDLVYLTVDADLEEIAKTGSFPGLGSLRDVRRKFEPMLVIALTQGGFPAPSRVALGVVMRHRVENKQKGYDLIADFVPVNVPSTTSDFLFQINYPIASKVIENLQINRLTKWLIGTLKFMRIRRFTGEFSEPQPIHAFTLEIDASTPASRAEALPGASLVPLFQELFTQAELLATHGASGGD